WLASVHEPLIAPPRYSTSLASSSLKLSLAHVRLSRSWSPAPSTSYDARQRNRSCCPSEVFTTPPPDHVPAMAAKGEAGPASAALPASDSDANSNAARVRLDPDISDASIWFGQSAPRLQMGSPVAGVHPVWLSQSEQRLQEIAHGFASFLRGRRIAADMRIERDAGVLVAEGFFRIVIHQNAGFALFEAAVPRRLGIGRYGDGADAEQAGIEAMFGIRIF